MAQKMKLSEAILLGSMLGPQYFQGLFDPADPTATCALGAAMLATGEEHEPWSWMRRPYLVQCPAGCIYSHHHVALVIAHLNDDHHWTRQRIAEWVATVETRELPMLEEQNAATEATSSLSPASRFSA